MIHRFWIMRGSRVKRDRRGKRYTPHVRCCQRGDLCLVGREASYGEAQIKLEPMAADILFALMLRQPGYVISNEELLEFIYEHPDYEAEGNPISVALSKVRIGLRQIAGPTIENLPHRGWRLNP